MPHLQTLHLRIFAIHVLQDIGMDQEMIKTGIENGTLIFRAALNLDTREILVPHLTCRRTHLVKIKARLLRFHVLAGILNADVRNTHLHGNRLILFRIIVEPDTYIIATHLTGITAVNLIFTCIGIPCSLRRHRTLLLPVTSFRGSFAQLHHKIDRKDSSRIVAEGTQQFASLNLRIIHEANSGPRLIGQSLSQMQQDMALSLREGKAAQSRTHGSRRLS